MTPLDAAINRPVTATDHTDYLDPYTEMIILGILKSLLKLMKLGACLEWMSYLFTTDSV
jgi:hypothetical protein